MAERRPSAPSLRLRLGLAFVAVAVAAVAALACVMLLVTNAETGRLSAQERDRTADQVAAELARAYRAAGSWQGADATPALALARGADAVLSVTDANGAPVVSDHRGGRGIGPGRRSAAVAETRAIDVDGVDVGDAELRFPARLTAAQSGLRSDLGRALLLGSVAAAAIALAAAALVTPRITRPLRRLAAATRRLRAGERDAPALDTSAPGELGELARAFEDMSRTLARQERARRRLVSDLAHEVRTPIAVLRGNLEALTDGVEEPTPARLASLHEETLRLGALVEQLDALADADQSPSALMRAPFDLGALAAAQLEAVSPQAEAKNVRVERRLAPVTLVGDRARLGQVVANLIGNALKFTPEGGRIEVVVTADGDDARLEVADTGPGIAAGEREHIFERFWRGSAGRGVSGRGIGLAVVAEIVSAHGGRVGVSDHPGGGARFAVTLPRG